MNACAGSAARVACLLLAAGTGSRFGGDKLLYPVDGQPMAAHAIQLHAGIPYALRIFVTQRRHAALAEQAAQAGFLVDYNDAPERGIASSIRVAMDLLDGQLIQPDGQLIQPDGLLFGVCDQPRLRRETVLLLLDRFREAPERIVAPVWQGRRGNPVVFPARFREALAHLEGDTGGSAVIRAHPDALLLVPVSDGAELTDIDTPPAPPTGF